MQRWGAIAPDGKITVEVEAAGDGAAILVGQPIVTADHTIVILPEGISGRTHRWGGQTWEPLPAPPPVIVTPQSITPLQARRVLRLSTFEASGEPALAGLSPSTIRAAIDTWLDADPSGARREEWEYAVELPRSSSLLAEGGAALGLSGEQIDALFRYAATM